MGWRGGTIRARTAGIDVSWDTCQVQGVFCSLFVLYQLCAIDEAHIVFRDVALVGKMLYAVEELGLKVDGTSVRGCVRLRNIALEEV